MAQASPNESVLIEYKGGLTRTARCRASSSTTMRSVRGGREPEAVIEAFRAPGMRHVLADPRWQELDTRHIRPPGVVSELKIKLPRAGLGEIELGRVERTVHLTARLSHPDRSSLFDGRGTHHVVCYDAMELVGGNRLQ